MPQVSSGLLTLTFPSRGTVVKGCLVLANQIGCSSLGEGGVGSNQDEGERLQLNHERCWEDENWPLEEKNSVRGQRGGLIAWSFCMIKFY